MKNPLYAILLFLVFSESLIGQTALADLTSLHIGQPSVQGSTEVSDGTYTIKADGRDIWESWDDFRFVYREISGDFEAVVRVVSFEPTHEGTQMGLMARQSIEPGSSFAFSLVTPWYGALLHWRASKDGEAEGPAGGAAVDTPIYLKLVRQGDKFSAFKSPDGQSWEESHANGITIEMKDPILLGLAVASHVNGRLTTAIFDNFTISGGEISTKVVEKKPLSLPQFHIQGDAYWDNDNNYFVLTNPQENQTGRIFLVNPYEMREWMAEFEIRIWGGGGADNGADGMTFAFVRRYDYPRVVGGSLDFGGEGYGIEFDTYPFESGTDPRGRHIALVKDNVGNHLTTVIVPDGIRDNAWHHVRVSFLNGQITVCYDDTEVISNYSIPDYTVFTGYFGFTASTGGGYEYHAVRNIRIAQKLETIHDVMISAVMALEEKLEPSKPVVPKARIFNAGSFDEADVPVSCEITTVGKVIYSSTQTIKRIASFQTQEVSFPEWIPQENEKYEVKVAVNLPNDACEDNNISRVKVMSMTPKEMLEALDKSAWELYQKEQYDEGIKVAKRALEMAEKTYGPDHPAVAISLNTLGHIYYQGQRKYSEAEPLFQRALEIREKKLEPDHLDVSLSLNNLACIYQTQGKFSEAEPLYKRALEIREKKLEPDHPDVALFLNNLAGLYQVQGKYTEAECLYKRVITINEKIYGMEHPNISNSLNVLAFLYVDLGKYMEAESLFKRALAINEKAFGPEHPDTANSLNCLSECYLSWSRYLEAEPLLKRSLAIYEKTYGTEDPKIADSLYRLALFYLNMGKYSEAEKMCQKAISIRKKAYNPENPLIAQALTCLGLIFEYQGKYSEAEPLFQQASSIYEKAFNSEHPYVATSMSYMADLYYDQKKYLEAEIIYKRVLAIYEKAFGSEQTDIVASFLGRMASLYLAQGKFSEAETLLQRSLAIYEKFLGTDSVPTIRSIYTLATLYHYQGRCSEAIALYKRALAIYEKNFGNDHPFSSIPLFKLAELETALNHPETALLMMQRAILINELTMDNVFSLASEREKFSFLRTIAYEFDILQSLVIQNLATDLKAVRIALDTTLRRKGLVLDALSRERMALLSSSNPKVSEISRQLQNTASSIASMTLAGPGKLSLEIYKSRLSELEAEKEQLEEELANLSGAYAAERQSRQVDADLIARALEPDSVLVEYVSYKRCNFLANDPKDKLGEQRYLAFVLPAGQNANPVLVDLGDAKTIDEAIHAFHQEAAGAAVIIPDIGEAEAERQLTEKGKRVYDLVFAPLKSAIGDSTVLYISPDGDLNLIPFGVLTDENGQYLVENHQFNYLSSGRDLLRFSQDVPAGTDIVVLADPDYNLNRIKTTPEPGPLLATNEPALRSTDFKTMLWYPLPNTRDEVEAILKELPGEKKVYLKDQALEEVVKSLHSPRILHIATHAFFLEEQDRNPWLESHETAMDMRVTDSFQKLLPAAPGIENPLLRSGLILAGANRLGQEEGDEDGILTALEISSLSLWGTDMVVLSACETGTGEARIGEGVFGLRRAFQLAGARTVVMSQWDIPDAETVSLMTDFYARLKSGTGKSQALREASLAQMKARRERSGAAHPFFWGAFVCVGKP